MSTQINSINQSNLTAVNQKLIRLTALWAFVESGLGALMHTMHLPFTGIILGGFSIILISLIAWFGTNPFTDILKATFIVMAVKASVYPATPPPAYIAVAFQGICGALFFSVQKRNLIVSIIFSIIAMLESGVQKLLILTILMGKSWLTAIDAFYQMIGENFGAKSGAVISNYLLLAYLGVYLVWGLLLGIWIYFIPIQIDQRYGRYAHLVPIQDIKKESTKRASNFIGWCLLLIIIGFYIYTFGYHANGWNQVIITILRTLSIIFIWIYFILPIWKKYVEQRLIDEKDNQKEVFIVLRIIPTISGYVKPLYHDVSLQYSGIRKWKEFVLGMIVISLESEHDE